MQSHAAIDRRSLRLAQAISRKLEGGDIRGGLEHARAVNRRWRELTPSRLHDDWAAILAGEWPAIRQAMLDESARGAQLRQNSPFCGILSPRERWAVYRELKSHET